MVNKGIIRKNRRILGFKRDSGDGTAGWSFLSRDGFGQPIPAK
jgi:hypothetical protein